MLHAQKTSKLHIFKDWFRRFAGGVLEEEAGFAETVIAAPYHFMFIVAFIVRREVQDPLVDLVVGNAHIDAAAEDDLEST